MTDLTPERIDKLEAWAKRGLHVEWYDVLALCRMARRALELEKARAGRCAPPDPDPAAKCG